MKHIILSAEQLERALARDEITFHAHCRVEVICQHPEAGFAGTVEFTVHEGMFTFQGKAMRVVNYVPGPVSGHQYPIARPMAWREFRQILGAAVGNQAVAHYYAKLESALEIAKGISPSDG